MLSILALIAFVIGLVVFCSAEKTIPNELGKMMMWCGFLVLLALAGGWHAYPLR